MLETSVYTDLDFGRQGRQIGSLKLAHSNDRYCFGIIPIPIAVLANGEGPTLLLTAGNHGDEYEGQVVLRRLIHELDPNLLQGRIIILPALNYPAVMDDARVSPLDNENFNRSFPGDPSVSPTKAIAHYIDQAILPLCDIGMDFHAAGKSAEYVPSLFLSTHPNQVLMERMMAVVDSFGAPYTLVFDGAGMPSSMDVYAQNKHGIPFVCTEAGGRGSVDPAIVKMTMQGVYRVLEHLGMIESHPYGEACGRTRFMAMAEAGCFLEAPMGGLFEPYCCLGDSVQAGMTAGRIYALDEPEREPVEVVFTTSGTIVGARTTAVVERGMFVFNVAKDISRDDVMGFSL